MELKQIITKLNFLFSNCCLGNAREPTDKEENEVCASFYIYNRVKLVVFYNTKLPTVFKYNMCCHSITQL